MTRYEQLSAVIHKLGTCTLAEANAQLPDWTGVQVANTAKNAARKKLVVCVLRSSGNRGQSGFVPSLWAACAAPKPVRVLFTERPLVSVWELGERAEQGRPFWKPRVPRQDFMTPEVE